MILKVNGHFSPFWLDVNNLTNFSLEFNSKKYEFSSTIGSGKSDLLGTKTLIISSFLNTTSCTWYGRYIGLFISLSTNFILTLSPHIYRGGLIPGIKNGGTSI